jgi:hypothetical protein
VVLLVAIRPIGRSSDIELLASREVWDVNRVHNLWIAVSACLGRTNQDSGIHRFGVLAVVGLLGHSVRCWGIKSGSRIGGVEGIPVELVSRRCAVRVGAVRAYPHRGIGCADPELVVRPRREVADVLQDRLVVDRTLGSIERMWRGERPSSAGSLAILEPILAGVPSLAGTLAIQRGGGRGDVGRRFRITPGAADQRERTCGDAED